MLERKPLSLGLEIGRNGRFLDGNVDRLGLKRFLVVLNLEGAEFEGAGLLGHEDEVQARGTLHRPGANGKARRLAPGQDCKSLGKLERGDLSTGKISLHDDREVDRISDVDRCFVDLGGEREVLRPARC